MASVEDRFWSRVDKTGECWLWTGCRDTPGYGQMIAKGIAKGAHRVAYTLLVGPIPDGMQIDHICHVKHCVNPEHLRVVTVKQNSENHNGPKRNNTSGYLGVSWHKRRLLWQASVMHQGKRYTVGFFGTAEAANDAVVARRIELYTHNDVDRATLPRLDA